MYRFVIVAAALPLLAACVPANGSVTLPEEVVAAAAPNQDLTNVELREDGCYWYSHAGPVETTMLPLRTRKGGPICVAVDEAPQT